MAKGTLIAAMNTAVPRQNHVGLSPRRFELSRPTEPATRLKGGCSEPGNRHPPANRRCSGKMELSVGWMAAGREDSPWRGEVVAVGRGRPGLCCPPDVSMMQATDFGNRHDRARLRPLDGSHVWRILVEREVSSCAVIIREVPGQEVAPVPLAENEDLVQTRPPGRADEPLR